jgi:pimeloyl-ACP methyl ester carboxylesterase
LSTITKPTKVIIGDSDPIISNSSAKTVQDQLSNSEFYSIKACDHGPFSDGEKIDEAIE